MSKDRDNIRTEHVYPPISARCFDWSATRESYEPGDLISYGATEQEAIEDLLSQEQERTEEAQP